MTAINVLYREGFPPARVCKVLESAPSSPCLSNSPAECWPFELCFDYCGRHYQLRTQTNPDGCFIPENVPLADGSGRTIHDLFAEGCPDFPWEGNDFPITIRELSRPGCELSSIHTDNGCCGQGGFSCHGQEVIYRYRRVYPAARAVFSPNFFGVKGCSDQYAAPPVSTCFSDGQSIPFSLEAAFENDLSGQELLRLTACMGENQTCARIPRTRFDAVGLLFSLPPGTSATAADLRINAEPLPDIHARKCGHNCLLLPEACAPGNTPFILTGYIAFEGYGYGEAFSLSAELLPAPYARFANRCADIPRPPMPRLQIRARKQVQGGVLRAGQFEFVLERENGCPVARSRNDAAGWIHFHPDPDVPLMPQGEWLVMRESTPRRPSPGWKLDSSRYRVFVRPYDGTVIYQGAHGILPAPPVFINRFVSLCSLAGTVSTSTGRPIPGWRILLHREGDDDCVPPLRSQTTDNRGCYCFDSLPRGRYRVSAVPREGWHPSGCTRYTVSVGCEPVRGIDFVFERCRPDCFEV